MGAGYALSDTRVIAGDAAQLNVTGSPSDVSLSVTTPFAVSPSARWDASLALHAKESTTHFSGAHLAAGGGLRTMKHAWRSGG